MLMKMRSMLDEMELELERRRHDAIRVGMTGEEALEESYGKFFAEEWEKFQNNPYIRESAEELETGESKKRLYEIDDEKLTITEIVSADFDDIFNMKL